MNEYLICGIALYILSYLFYIKISRGLGHKAEYLQLRRFFPCAVLAVLPCYLVQLPLTSPQFLISLFIGVTWIITYPLFYYITYHKNSTDFGFHLDTVFGLYIIGWLTGLKILVQYFNFMPTVLMAVISVAEFSVLLIPVLQWLYFAVYKTSVNENALSAMLITNYNEIIEFFKSMPKTIQILSPVLLAALLYGIITANEIAAVQINNEYYLYALIAVTIFLTIYLWEPTKKGVFVRTGIIELFSDVKHYIKETNTYAENLNQRLKNLQVTPAKPDFDKPSTIIMVIGESESRDYMSAFTDYDKDTTPWLNANKDSNNFFLFRNSYACHHQTVPSLERALTEANQYNDKKFYESCSVIDIARKAGYTTHWYSNQGHLGGADTAVTLVADTADTTKWTRQNLNQVQYDESLLDYLDEVDPSKNNFVVIHLKGNHFNFLNRYPESFTKWGEPGKYDLILNYINSIAYTDHILESIWKYGIKNLNLQAMVYFSDHATIPDKRRSSNFDGFATVRIPMFVYLADEYIAKYPDTYSALKNNKDKYFTNDLAYELMCGVFNIKSNHYDETNSIASSKYKYTRDMLKTDIGNKWIKDDNN